MAAPTWDALILASAAVTAAGLAAWTANRRIDKQLHGESKRLGQQLDAEAQRLGLQLEQDLEKHRRSELRDILDEGAVLIMETWACFRVIRDEGALDPEALAKRLRRAGEDDCLPAIKVAPEIFRQLEDYWQRLMLRFDVHDTMTTSVDGMTEAFREAVVLYEVPFDQVDQARQQRFEDLMERFEDARAAFVGECQEQFGIRPGSIRVGEAYGRRQDFT